jgi:hypothetical protein
VRYVIDFYFNEEKAGTPQVWDGANLATTAKNLGSY